MTTTLNISLSLLLSGAALACSTALPQAPADEPRPTNESGAVANERPDISGRWKSGCVKTGDDQSIGLAFDLGASDWKLDYTTFGDATCASAFVTVRVEGSYEVVAPSAAVAGAWNARFGFSRKTVTPHSPAAAGFAASEKACGGGTFEAGRATDVSAKGCAGLGQYPIASCGADFDLVSLDDGKLRFGDRPKDNDMCTDAKRPAALAELRFGRAE